MAPKLRDRSGLQSPKRYREEEDAKSPAAKRSKNEKSDSPVHPDDDVTAHVFDSPQGGPERLLVSRSMIDVRKDQREQEAKKQAKKRKTKSL